MSLINEALKKAQRVRHDDPAESLAPMNAGGPRIAKRERAKSATTMLLIGGGVLVLVAASVVATIFFVNRPAAPAPAPIAAAAPKAAPPSSTPAPAPLIAVTEPAAPAPGATTTTPAPKATPTVTVTLAKPAVAATEPAPVPAPAKPAFTVPVISAAPPPPPPDERTASFVESIRVAGIRSSGPEGRVLMNDRVYKLNDVVDRGLSLKLTAISAGSLTFTDPNGVTYVKNF